MSNGSKYYKELDLSKTELAILLEDNVWVEGKERPKAKITIPVLFPLFDVNNIVEGKVAKDGVVLDTSNYVEVEIPAYLYPDYITRSDGTRIKKIDKGFHFIVTFVSGWTTKIRIIGAYDPITNNKWVTTEGGGDETPVSFNINDLNIINRSLSDTDFMAVQDSNESDPLKVSLNTLSEYMEDKLHVTAEVPQEVLDQINNNSSNIESHIENDEVHVTSDEKSAWNRAQVNTIERIKVDGNILEVDEKCVNIEGIRDSNLHIANNDLHVSSSDRINWNKAQENLIEKITLDGVELSINDKTVNVESSTEVLSVKSVGCVGDGVTDDTENFKAALSQACELGKILYIDRGTYLITDRLIITDTISIMGASQSESIIKYRAEVVEETAYGQEYYEESNACFIIKASNTEISNLTLNGGDNKDEASDSNGIIMHYTKPNGTQYDAAQRVAITNVDIKCFKNGLFLYAGWNRYITRCNFVDCSENGVMYYPLEKDTVGQWAASGDVFIACQFIGNLNAGFNAFAAFETTVWNSVFEYNDRAIKTENCRDVCFKNCWNEANTNNIYIKGSCKFEGGYNINNGTVTHELIGGNDLVQFEAENLITMCRLGEVIFNQVSGIITKGVEIGAELENLVKNPYFEEASGGTATIPSSTNWDFYPGGATSITDDDPNYTTTTVTGATSDTYYGLWAAAIAVEPTKSYSASAWIKVDSRSAIDSSGVMCYIAWKNSNGETIVIDNRPVTMIGDNIWELKEWALTAPNQAASLIIGWGLARNGVMHLKEPQVNYDDGITRSNVLVRQSTEDVSTIKFLNASGSEIGTINFDDLTELFQSVSDGKLAIATAITDKGVETAATDTFETMANNIYDISTGGSGSLDVTILGNIGITICDSVEVISNE